MLARASRVRSSARGAITHRRMTTSTLYHSVTDHLGDIECDRRREAFDGDGHRCRARLDGLKVDAISLCDVFPVEELEVLAHHVEVVSIECHFVSASVAMNANRAFIARSRWSLHQLAVR